MALFVSSLALTGPSLDLAKVAVLGASAMAAFLGMTVLFVLLPNRTSGGSGAHD